MNEWLLKVSEFLNINTSALAGLPAALEKQELTKLVTQQLSLLSLKGALGGGILSLPIYQWLAIRRSIRIAKKFVRIVIRLVVALLAIALVLKLTELATTSM